MRGKPKKTNNIELGQFEMCANFYKQIIEDKQNLQALKEAIQAQSEFNLKLTELERTEFVNLRWRIESIFEDLTRFVNNILNQAKTTQSEMFKKHADQVKKEDN